MIALSVVGIGTGNPDHLTRQGIAALNAVDVILIPRKGHGKGSAKADLAELRQSICAAVVSNPATRIVYFDMPLRDSADADYTGAVNRWHDAIANIWYDSITKHLPQGGNLALLVWGDPSLYDSTLRIAERLKLRLDLHVSVVPGITALQALTAAHAIPLNEINASVTITTGRRLREAGWPASANTIAVMLDGDCAFRHITPTGVTIWWGAYLGMPEQVLVSGPLAEVSGQILQQRQSARAAHGWIMDTYLLRRAGGSAGLAKDNGSAP